MYELFLTQRAQSRKGTKKNKKIAFSLRLSVFVLFVLKKA